MKFEPKWIAWEITRRCNLHCIHCRSSSQLDVAGHPDFSFAKACEVVDTLASYANPVVVLSGGEPLLREDVFDIARYGKTKGLRICLASNGTLISETTCREILSSGIKMVALSLDGATAATHDNFRSQQGAFAGTMNAIDLLRRHNIPFLINSSFSLRNHKEIPAIYRLVKDLGATAWYMFMIVPTGRGEEIQKELIPQKIYDEILNWHYDMEKEEQDLLVRPTCAPHYYRIMLERDRKEKSKTTRRSLSFSTGGSKGCLAGQLICMITVDGDVMPCSYFPLAAGNIFREKFAKIWEESQLFLELRDFTSYKNNCGCCEYLNVCGGCRARAYATTGDYLNQEPYCDHIPLALRKNTQTSNS